MTESPITLVSRDGVPEFRYSDVDGDRLMFTTAVDPEDGAHGVYFRTDIGGCAVRLEHLDALINHLNVVRDYLTGDGS